MKSLIVALISFATMSIITPRQSHAQWVQMSPYWGGEVLSVAASGVNIFAGTDGKGIFRSTDNGTSWERVDGGLILGMVLTIAIVDSNILAGTYGGFYLSTDNGTSWHASGLVADAVYALAISGSKIFAGTCDELYHHGVFVSTDNGVSWQPSDAGLPASACVLSLGVAGSNLFAGAAGVFRSTDDGASWQPTGLTSSSIRAFAMSGSYVFVGADRDSGIFLSTDGGASWQAANSGLTNRSVISFAVSGPAVFAGTEGSGVFLSTDNGTSWESVNPGLTSGYVYALAVTDTDIFAGTSVVFRRPLSEMIPQYHVANKWNIVSLPVRASDCRKATLFPTAVSAAFAYESGYVQEDTLSVGAGYWLKFNHEQIVPLHGSSIIIDSFDVAEGWNLIGSTSYPVAATNITSEPPNMITSDFFGYKNGYLVADTVEPGRGYWVKCIRDGKLILSAWHGPLSANRIMITHSPELPPPPPRGENSDLQSQIPNRFALAQNFPNPFNPTTVIRYQLPVNSYVNLRVYNTLGQVVVTLVDRMQDAGYKTADFQGNYLPSGVYFYRLQVGNPATGSGRWFSDVKKLILTK